MVSSSKNFFLVNSVFTKNTEFASASAPHQTQLMEHQTAVTGSHLPTGFAFSQAAQSVAMFHNRLDLAACKNNNFPNDTCNVEKETEM